MERYVFPEWNQYEENMELKKVRLATRYKSMNDVAARTCEIGSFDMEGL